MNNIETKITPKSIDSKEKIYDLKVNPILLTIVGTILTSIAMMGMFKFCIYDTRKYEVIPKETYNLIDSTKLQYFKSTYKKEISDKLEEYEQYITKTKFDGYIDSLYANKIKEQNNSKK